MLRFLAGRLVQSALILLGVTIVTFGLTFLIPADPVRIADDAEPFGHQEVDGHVRVAEVLESFQEFMELLRFQRTQFGHDLPAQLQGAVMDRADRDAG